MMNMEYCWNDINREKTKALGEKPVTVPLCPLKVSQGLNWSRNRACLARDRRLKLSSYRA
jgi:hypothetical protein